MPISLLLEFLSTIARKREETPLVTQALKKQVSSLAVQFHKEAGLSNGGFSVKTTLEPGNQNHEIFLIPSVFKKKKKKSWFYILRNIPQFLNPWK